MGRNQLCNNLAFAILVWPKPDAFNRPARPINLAALVETAGNRSRIAGSDTSVADPQYKPADLNPVLY